MSRTHPAHLFGSRRTSRRSRALLAVLGATVSLAILGTGAAFGYWNLTQSNPAKAVANSLGQGATPTASVSLINPSSVTITFAQVSTTSGGVEIPAPDYILKRYPAGGTSPVVVTASCSGTGTITCIETPTLAGAWQYTDTPTYATNWVGIESAKSPVAAVSTAPSVTITYPVNGTTYGPDWAGKITGTASSNAGAGTSISAVSLAIENTTTNRWWNGISFIATTQTFEEATNTTSWTLPLGAASLTSGDSYSVSAEATDSLGNIATSSTVAFAYNTTAPTVVVTYPVNGKHYDATTWGGQIQGTASSNSGAGTTITATALAIEDTITKLWWTGSKFSSSSEIFVPVSGTTTWSLVFASGNLTSGDSYSVVAQTTDSAGNVGTSTPVAFTYCNRTTKVPPTVIITYPLNGATYGSNWLGAITGTASSNSGPLTTITGVSVAVENTTTNKWWNGSTFSLGTPSFVAATGKTTWMLALAATDNLTSGDSYSVIAEATDSAGNIGTSQMVSFTYWLRTAPPTVTITYPVSGATYGSNWLPEITGTALSNSGPLTTIKNAAVAVENTKTGKWWTSTGFNATSQSFNTASGTTTWNLPFAAGNLTSGVTYGVVAEATDSLGNIGTSATVAFTYCVRTASPKVSITYPVSGTTYGTDWGGAISGSASAGTGATIAKTTVAVEDTTTGKWWSGSSFSASSQSFVTATGTTTWSLPLPVGKLTSGNAYSAVAQATDSYGNIGTSTTVSFAFNTSPPTVSVTYPVNGTTYGGNWTGKITGTASTNAGPGTSITGVSAAVENTKTIKWWNGSAFSASIQSYNAASGTTAWTLALAAGNLTSGVTYKVVAQATDSAGNVGTSPAVSFTYNSSPPTVAISYPVNKSCYGANWAGKITGTASSNSGVGTTITSVSVAIENTKTSRWWNGTSFSATSQTFVTASGTTSWSLLLATEYLSSGTSYDVIAEATDSLGNIGTSATVAFTYRLQCTAHALKTSHDGNSTKTSAP